MNFSGRNLEMNVGEGGFPSPVRIGNIVRVKKHFCHTLRCVLTRNYSVIGSCYGRGGQPLLESHPFRSSQIQGMVTLSP